MFAVKVLTLTCIFSNLTYELSERKLEEVFIMAGEIRDLRIPKKGHAIIEYHKTTDALRKVLYLTDGLKDNFVVQGANNVTKSKLKRT